MCVFGGGGMGCRACGPPPALIGTAPCPLVSDAPPPSLPHGSIRMAVGAPPPPPDHRGKKRIYHWENLVGPFLVREILGQTLQPLLTPPPPPAFYGAAGQGWGDWQRQGKGGRLCLP